MRNNRDLIGLVLAFFAVSYLILLLRPEIGVPFLMTLAGMAVVIALLNPSVWVRFKKFLNGEALLQDAQSQVTKQAVRDAIQHAAQYGGETPNDSRFRLTDIGLLVYHGDNHPKIYETGDVPTDATHLRPFVKLYSSAVSEQVRVRFQIIDAAQRTCYAAVEAQLLSLGENLVTPSTWLPVADQQPGEGVWKLGVSLGSTLVAVHQFGWMEVGGEKRTLFNGDGEIDPAAFAEKDEETLSLDELTKAEPGVIEAETVEQH